MPKNPLRILEADSPSPELYQFEDRSHSQRAAREAELTFLLTLAKAVNSAQDLQTLLRRLAEQLKGRLALDAICLYLIEDGVLYLAASTTITGEVIRRELPADHPVWKALAENSIWVDNHWNGATSGDAESIHDGSLMGLPLVAEGSPFGVLAFRVAQVDAYLGPSRQLVQSIEEQVSVAIRKTWLLQQSRQAEQKYRALVDSADAIVWDAAINPFRFTFVSPQAEQWLGYPVAQWIDDTESILDRIHPEDRAAIAAAVMEGSPDNADFEVEYRITARDGRELWWHEMVSVEQSDSKPPRLRGITIDITERKRAESALQQSNAILKATQDAAADGFVLVDNKGNISSYNQRFVEIWHISPELEQELSASGQMLHYLLSLLRDPDEFIDKIDFLYDNPEASTRDEIELRDSRVLERYSAPALLPHGQSYGRVWSFSDITDRKQYEQQLAEQAFYDNLTRLPNRALFMNRLSGAIKRSKRHHKMTALLFLDLDRFKIVNDSLGHEHGDQLLIQVAQRLQACLRPSDSAARFGGDEFTILLEEITSIHDATHIAERVAEMLQLPFDLLGHEVYSSASIGIVVSKDDTDRADDLLRNADLAMYYAKHKGKAQYAVFDMQMGTVALERLEMEIDLRQAIKHQELELYYQPLVDLELGRVVGAEALLRWNHPQRGLVMPLDFIPLAEETGFILPIGRWVLRQACTQIRALQDELAWESPFEVSINLSAKQFQQSDLVGDITRVLRETSFPPKSLKLEITESVIMEDAQTTSLQLESLKQLGVQLAVDDFGIGYSSLSYLKKFQLDAIKVDRSFISRMDSDAKDLAIIHAVSSLGKALGLSVTAEGVETIEQLERIRSIDCHVGQGFFFSLPLTYDQLRDFLNESHSWKVTAMT